MKKKRRFSDNTVLRLNYWKFIMTILVVLYSLVFHGCAPHSKLIDTQIEKTGKTKTRDSKEQKFAYSHKLDSEFLVKSGKVEFNLTQSVYDKDIGNEYKEIKVFEDGIIMFPHHRNIFNEMGDIKTGLLCCGALIALDLATGAKGGLLLIVEFANMLVEISMTIESLSSGDFTIGERFERKNYYYRDWALHHGHTKVIPLANNSANISIPEVSFTKSYTTDSKGNISVDLKQILTDHPLDEIMSIAVECKFKDPGGKWQENSITIKEKDVIELIERLE